MSPLAVMTMCACFLSAFFVFLRSELLGPRLHGFYSTSLAVRITLDLVALAFAWCGLEIAGRAPLPTAFAVLMMLCAASSGVLLTSMIIHAWRDAVRNKDAEDTNAVREAVREAVAEAVPSAVDSAIPNLFKDVATYPDRPDGRIQ